MEDSDLFYDDFGTYECNSTNEYRDAYEDAMELANKYADKYKELIEKYEDLQNYYDELKNKNEQLKNAIEELKYYSEIGIDYMMDYVNKKEIIENDIKISKNKILKVPRIVDRVSYNKTDDVKSSNIGEGILGTILYGISKLF